MIPFHTFIEAFDHVVAIRGLIVIVRIWSISWPIRSAENGEGFIITNIVDHRVARLQGSVLELASTRISTILCHSDFVSSCGEWTPVLYPTEQAYECFLCILGNKKVAGIHW